MKTLLIFIGLVMAFTFSCNNKNLKSVNTVHNTKDIEIKTINYSANGKNYQSIVTYPKNSKTPLPVVMVIPEWWGLSDYTKNRAKQLAELGYFAVGVDFYGDGKIVDDPKEARGLAMPFYQNSKLAKDTFDAARNQLKNFKEANLDKVAVIGYCFGGAQALNMARQEDDLKAAVSFHGNLETGVKPNNSKVKILVCNGANDTFVSAEEIEKFKKEMDSAKITYQFIDYPNSIHSFTNPAATEIGKKYGLKVAYNKEADLKSWNDMKTFLREAFK